MRTLSQLWQDLRLQADTVPSLHSLFADNPHRAAQMCHQACGLYVDISKQHISKETLQSLCRLAAQSGVKERRADMFAGAPVNTTEGRPVLHMALRGMTDDQDIAAQVQAGRKRIAEYADKIRASGKIKNIVHIGIGGSDLGPRLLADVFGALSAPALNLRFVNNVDGLSIRQALDGLNPKETLVIIVSKSFSTIETKLNGAAARDWLGAYASENLLAVTANTKAALDFGIDKENIFEFWQWVGGRFSLWSAVSLSLTLAYGADTFSSLLKGAQDMDRHFLAADLEENLPVLLALVDVWNRSFLGRPARAIIPYARALRRLPDFLQQLEMESLGKTARLDGGAVETSAQIIFGDEGTNAQHAFFQQLHQGPDILPVDFLAVLEDRGERPAHHRTLLANCIAQSEALMIGQKHENAHRNFSGNRPSTTFILPRLDAYNLGALLALFEHKVFVASVIWDINAFDQFGVELGKVLADKIEAELLGGTGTHDPSTSALIALARKAAKS